MGGKTLYGRRKHEIHSSVQFKCMLRVTKNDEKQSKNYTVQPDWLCYNHDYCIANRASVTSGTRFLHMHSTISTFPFLIFFGLICAFFYRFFARRAFNCMIRCYTTRSTLFSILILIELNYNKLPFNFFCHMTHVMRVQT